MVYFSDIFLHERFFAGSLHNDLALLRLAEDVDWGLVPHVAPACLPRAHATFTGSRCWVTGWGQVGTRGYTRAGKEISRKCLQGLRTKHLRSFVDTSLAEQVISIILICRTPSTLRASCRPPCRRWTCPWWRPRSASGRSAARDSAAGRDATA